MSRTIFISLLVLGLFACSKEVQNNKYIDGEWTPDSMVLKDYDGIDSHPTCTGSMIFKADGKKSSSGTYQFELYFDYKGDSVNLIDQGQYQIQDGNVLTLNSIDGSVKTGTIVYRTKEDLIFETSENYLSYHFVMKQVTPK